jgi:Carbohydrate family 9 binding domain-like
MHRFAFVWFVALAASGCVEQAPDMPSEEDIKAAREHILTQPPANIQHRVDADLEDKVTYLGCDVDTEVVTPGKPFTLTHYWKVNKSVGDDWRLFIHLEAPETKKNHLNADHIPINGKYPVRVWKAGEIIRDQHRVSVPQAWNASAVEIYVGLWKGPVRMKVTKGAHDAENRVLAVKLPTEQSQKVERRKLITRHIKTGVIKLDGKLDEKEWKDAPSTGAFVRTMDGLMAEQKTAAKVLWDDKYLWVAFDVEDKDVWSTLDKRDDKLWTQEAVELFIDADGDGKTYVELQTNPKGAIFDSYLPGYRQNQNDFDAGMKVAVKVDGTLDNRNDVDKGWTVEMQIPLDAAKGKNKEMKNVPPKVGTEWRVNFFRLDMPAGRPQWGAAWSPPLVGDFHALDKFGALVFGDDKGTAPGVQAPPPSAPPAVAPAPIAPGPGGAAKSTLNNKLMQRAPNAVRAQVHSEQQ